MPSPGDKTGDSADRDLRNLAASGDSRALDALLVRHLPGLRAFVRLRVGAEVRAHESCSDLVQSVCRELVEDWPRLDFADDAAFRAWLFTAALNKVRERARYLQRHRRDVRREVGGTAGADLAAGYAVLSTPSALANSAEQIARLEAAFDQLSEDHREVLTLARLAGLPLKVVGERMGGRSPGAVTMLLGRAMATLGAILDRGPANDR
jgi:RNA polymerase sigma factor (sigma-70 family)